MIIWRSTHHNNIDYRRTIHIHPGYDDRGKRDGGWHNDEWIFVVGRDRGALALAVNTARMHGELIKGWSDKQGRDLTLHLSFPSTPEEVLSERSGGCSWLEGQCYTPYSTALGAVEFWPESTYQEFDDVERFYRFVFPWSRLAERFEELYVPRLQASTELPHRCQACGGKGLVPR